MTAAEFREIMTMHAQHAKDRAARHVRHGHILAWGYLVLAYVELAFQLSRGGYVNGVVGIVWCLGAYSFVRSARRAERRWMRLRQDILSDRDERLATYFKRHIPPRQ